MFRNSLRIAPCRRRDGLLPHLACVVLGVGNTSEPSLHASSLHAEGAWPVAGVPFRHAHLAGPGRRSRSSCRFPTPSLRRPEETPSRCPWRWECFRRSRHGGQSCRLAPSTFLIKAGQTGIAQEHFSPEPNALRALMNLDELPPCVSFHTSLPSLLLAEMKHKAPKFHVRGSSARISNPNSL